MMRSYCKASVIAFAISCDSRFPKVSNFFGFPAVYGEDSTSSPSWSKLKVKNHIRCQFFQIHANAQKKRGRLWRTRSWRRSRRCLATTQWGSLRRMRPARRWYFQCRASIVPSTTVRTHYIHIDMDDINYIYIYIHIVCIYIYINTHTYIYIYTHIHAYRLHTQSYEVKCVDSWVGSYLPRLVALTSSYTRWSKFLRARWRRRRWRSPNWDRNDQDQDLLDVF